MHHTPFPILPDLTVEQLEAQGRAQAQEEIRIKSLPPEQFEREMRLREVRALERSSHRRTSVTVYNGTRYF